MKSRKGARALGTRLGHGNVAVPAAQNIRLGPEGAEKEGFGMTVTPTQPEGKARPLKRPEAKVLNSFTASF